MLNYTVIGDTVHLATQLQKIAETSTILISFATYQRSRPIIDYQNYPIVQLEGVAEPVKVFRPLGVRLRPRTGARAAWYASAHDRA